ncbi:serine/threonine-protein kinase meng-po-like [Macrosteles quadrilineatus]|uniref:serine/threonine-protein kinase meng-po-like n=1 Tax=Macrosteles quadrilineatus TaxID=74068 RepID=UPI0023E0FE47|nr:serine/threonine-protein kinase meng-po-like [Macrosteles quadrilineatus]XP_054286995.1 serine/threonine-protein kinase meng-po-like [Macrosteles quadrilineatus]
MRADRAKESSLHRIQECPLQEVDLETDYEVDRDLGEGCFAKIVLATHKQTGTSVVLKMIHEELTTLKDFYREFHYSYHLSPHPNILCSYPVAFKAANCWVFAQEYAPLGDLSGVVRAGGVPETSCKKVARQLCSALEFLHSKQLVHRDIKLENILVFAADLSTIKLCDFGETRKEGLLVNKVKCTWHQFLPPEVCEAVKNERFLCRPASDCWQVGIVLYVCLTGCPPWKSADLTDPEYRAFSLWQRRRSTKVPNQLKRFTPRLQRLFRRIWEAKPEKRGSVTEVSKYLKDSWLIDKDKDKDKPSALAPPERLERRNSAELYLHLEAGDDLRSLADESKNRMRKLLSSYGLETTVDQQLMTSRVWDWINSCDSTTPDSPESG